MELISNETYKPIHPVQINQIHNTLEERRLKD